MVVEYEVPRRSITVIYIIDNKSSAYFPPTTCTFSSCSSFPKTSAARCRFSFVHVVAAASQISGSVTAGTNRRSRGRAGGSSEGKEASLALFLTTLRRHYYALQCKVDFSDLSATRICSGYSSLKTCPFAMKKGAC